MYRFAVATTLATFLLLVVGGTVNPTGSSLACPDWPLCFGQFFPEMKGGVRFEHTHRLVASGVGVMTLILAIGLWRIRSPQRKLGVLALALVVVQAVLGGVTVLLKLPPAVSLAHLAVSMLYFALLIVIAYRARPRARAAVLTSDAISLYWANAAAALVLLQVLLGGLVRHFGSALACGTDVVLCAGRVWPFWPRGQLHMLHRFGALLVMVVLVGCAIVVRRRLRGHNALARATALAAPILALVQTGLGLLTVYQAIALVPVTAHLAIGALLWADMVVLSLALRLPSPAVVGDEEVVRPTDLVTT